MLRRRSATAKAKSYVLGSLRLDVRRREATLGDSPLQLTHKEFDLLAYLLAHRGEAVSRDEVLDAIWPGVFVTSRTVDTHVSSLRKKLEEAPGRRAGAAERARRRLQAQDAPDRGPGSG